MTDPTVGPATPVTPRSDNQKPTKALPTDRVGFERQMAILRAFGAIAGEEGKTAAEIGEVIPISSGSVSVCNPFFLESGLIERVGGGNKALADVVAYHRAMEWDVATAGQKLAPALRNTWYWKILAPRLSVRAIEDSEAVRLLAEECNAGPSYGSQIRTILEYLEVAALVVRDGGLLRRGPTAAPSGGAPPDAGQPPAVDKTPHVLPPPPVHTAPIGISFEASIQISMEEIGTWTPEQIKEFFAGLAVVVAAKKKAAT